jgi:hypothetical protein
MKTQESKRASVILHLFNLVFVKLPKDKWLRNFIYKNIFVAIFLLLKYFNWDNSDGISWVRENF